MLKSFKIYTCTNGALGLHLSRAPWDPYPWVSSIQKDSTSFAAGLRMGDCLLELNGQDVLGMKISEIAALLKNHWLNESRNYVTAVIWRNKSNNSSEDDAAADAATADDEDEENNAHNINQQSLQKFATCLQHIAQLLECPVCLEVIKPPGWQCCNGHVLCNNCRSRSEKCPVCRVPLGPRGRCLLSDKLFTLLADSFPCDGVRSNKNSPKDRRKCSTEFHNQPKMAMVQKQQQQHKDEGEIKAKHLKKSQQDFILTTAAATSLRRRRKASWHKIEEVKEQVEGGEMIDENKYTTHHLSMDEAMYDTNSMSNNSRKSSQDYSDVVAASTLRQPASSGSSGSSNIAAVTMTTATFFNDELLGPTSIQQQQQQQQQCHCITCYKPDKVAIVNNVTTATTLPTTTLNKYILRLPSEQQPTPAQEEGQENIVQQQQQEKYQNYQCPTGKLCCLTKNVMPSATYTTITTNTSLSPDTIITNNITSSTSSFTTAITNNNLSTKQTNAQSTQSSNAGQQPGQQCEQQGYYEENNHSFHKTLKNEWEILAHLTQDHHLPVQQYYAEYGQRIQVQCDRQQKSLTCLNLKNSNTSKVEKFFIACIPLSMANPSLNNSTKVAIFIYHMNALATTSAISVTDEVSNFETIIENPQTGIKWFGRAHCLTTPWSQIYHKQHFLMHDVLENVVADDGATVVGGGDVSDAFVIVIKTKL